MSLTREDVLRELELLPVWQLRSDAVLAKPAPPPAIDALEDQPELEQALIAAPTISQHLLETSEIICEHLEADLPINQVMVEPKVSTNWLLCCPETQEAEACQTILNNIIRAMQLLQGDYVLVQHTQDLTRYQAQKTLLFGLATYNQCAQTAHDDVESLRGVPQPLGQGEVWVTYHPAQMWADPALKRGAWQDICAALAHHSNKV